MAVLNKTHQQLVEILRNEEISYNVENKKDFENIGKSFLKALGKKLKFKKSKVSFNAGGIAVSGDLQLYGMWDTGKGVYININKSFGVSILYRSIESMNDYTGGTNRYFDMFDFESIEGVIERLDRMKGGMQIDSLYNEG